ncbi:MAG: enoyl-CoA hydratase [Geminicoccaceae bacterium]|nr:MAG: enoyl-CoA hydratase [Geminicoccaceae bacterium]
MTEDLLYERKGPIGYVTFNRPHARNAFTFAMYDRLREIFEGVPDEAGLKVLVLTGAGEKAFAAGTDIAEFRAFSTPEDALAYEERGNALMALIERTPIPTIAAIAGACTGGGAGIATSCDLRIAMRNAKIGFPIARTLGNCLSMENYARLAAALGMSRAKEMIFTARLIGAEEALTAGFVAELVDDHATLQARATELAEQLAGYAPLTLAATKEAFRRLRDGEREGKDLILSCYMSQDFKEGMDAFLTKRQPQWTGK